MFSADACDELATKWLNVAQQHQVVPVLPSRHAGIWLFVCRVCFMKNRFCGLPSGRKTHASWPNLWDTVVQSRRYEDNIDDEMSRSMVCCTGDTRVRPALEHVVSHPRTRMLPSSWSLLEVWQCAPALHATTGTLHRFPVSVKFSNAMTTSSVHHVPDFALKPAGLFPVRNSFPVSFGAALELDWTPTSGTAAGRSPETGGPLVRTAQREVPPRRRNKHNK